MFPDFRDSGPVGSLEVAGGTTLLNRAADVLSVAGKGINRWYRVCRPNCLNVLVQVTDMLYIIVHLTAN